MYALVAPTGSSAKGLAPMDANAMPGADRGGKRRVVVAAGEPRSKRPATEGGETAAPSAPAPAESSESVSALEVRERSPPPQPAA